jgi:predicted nicotinamide N-methyase
MPYPTNSSSGHEYLQNELRAILPDAKLLKTTLPLVPEINLFLLDECYPQHSLDAEQLAKIMDYPAYWSFCWASGQVMARYLLDNRELVADKCVLDFGCGSGVVGIAAAMAGAKKVVACDIDRDALLVTKLNASINNVELSYLAEISEVGDEVDLLIAADVLYDKSNLALLDQLTDISAKFLLADSRIKDFSFPGFNLQATMRSHTVPDLAESEEFSQVRLYLR